MKTITLKLEDKQFKKLSNAREVYGSLYGNLNSWEAVIIAWAEECTK